ncbi:caspase family protein [Pseudomonas brassicacearum]|uniref:caspase family protein n=1 Tax=Pseudomonas brassicacearum TaxID=930166 RepID=UPI000F48CA40|nr:caspase family protein [Pseudomonas brassicacearum]
MSKKALVIGIDDYPEYALRGCVKDAVSVSRLLDSHGNGDPNFNVIELLSSEQSITYGLMLDSIKKLFTGDADVALLYFAGHGIIDESTNHGFLVSQDGRDPGWGVPLSQILGLANAAYPKIKSSVIVLDCCHSGKFGESDKIGANGSAEIGTGVTILTACHRNEAAIEGQSGGVFTELLIDGLSGGCADIRGHITPAAIYSYVDQTLGSWEQRPIYKANVQSFITLRKVANKVPDDVLRKLPLYFDSRSSIYKLDPSYEPDRKNIPEEFRDLPINEENVRIFKELQLLNRHGLIIPDGAEHMYYAAINSQGCKLTALGAHYRKLAEMKRI